MSDRQRAIETLKELAAKKAAPVADKVRKRSIASLEDLGIGEDALKYAAGAAMAADALNKGEIEGGLQLNDDLEIRGKISPRERAIKLLYNKDF